MLRHVHVCVMYMYMYVHVGVLFSMCVYSVLAILHVCAFLLLYRGPGHGGR